MKNFSPLFLAIACIIFLSWDTTYTQTSVSNDIVMHTTWDISGSPYVLEGSIMVEPNVTLTIEPGVVIKFDQDHQLTVKGQLLANGTTADSIIFTSIKDDQYGGDTNADGSTTSPGPGDWLGIQIDSLSGSSSTFDYCRFHFGGDYDLPGEAVIMIPGSNPTIQHSTFYKCEQGLSVYRGGEPIINHNRFEENTVVPLSFSLDAIPIYTGNSFVNNTITAIGLEGFIYHIPESNLTLSKRDIGGVINIPYYMDWRGDLLTIGENTSLTIDPGVVIKAISRGLNIKGNLNAQGTVAEPIVFTSLKDDSWGGDTNGDGSSTTPQEGNWDGIKIDSISGNSSVLRNCLFSFGGDHSEAGEAVLSVFGSSPEIDQCHFYVCEKGLSISYGGAPIVSNNTFEGNTIVPISISLDATPLYSNNTFVGNERNAIGLEYFQYTTPGTSYTLKKQDIAGFVNIPYLIFYAGGTASKTFTIDTDVTLNIEPGVVIKFENVVSLAPIMSIRGILVADGTADEPIIFTSVRDDEYGGDTNADGGATIPETEDWSWISTEANDNNNINYCHFRYGGRGQYDIQGYGLSVSGDGSPVISNCIFYKCRRGLALFGQGTPIIQSNTFEENTRVPIMMEVETNPSFSGNTFINNARNGLELAASAFNPSGADTMATLEKISVAGIDNIPYIVLSDGLIIENGATLEIEPGVIIKGELQSTGHDDNALIKINGALIAHGTESEPIIFTYYRDDTFGGDSNNDGDASDPSSGYYPGIKFGLNSSGSSLKNCTFLYADVGLTIESSEVSIDACRFFNNSLPIRIALTEKPSLQNLDIRDNRVNGIGIKSGIYENGSAVLEKRDSFPYIIGADAVRLSFFTWLRGLRIENNFELTVEPGTIIKIRGNDDPPIEVKGTGTLRLLGKPDSMIVITSLHDDEYGGDTNNDGDAVEPERGEWEQILIRTNSSDSELRNCRFRYAKQAVDIRGTSSIFENCIFSENEIGLESSNGATLQIDTCLFTNNEIGIKNIDAGLTIRQSSFTENEPYDIENLDVDDVDARYNQWGVEDLDSIFAYLDGNLTNFEDIFDVHDDPGVGEVLIDNMIIPRGISSVVPGKVIQLITDSVTVEIKGYRFEPGAEILLRKDNAPDIFPYSFAIMDTVSASFSVEITDIEPGLYDICLINAPGDTLRKENGLIVQDTTDFPFNQWVPFEVKNGNVFASEVAVPNVDNLFVFLKKSTRNGYANTWNGNLSLTNNGEEIITEDDFESIAGGSSADIDIHLKAPLSGSYVFEIETTEEQGKGQIIFTDAPPVLQLGEWAEGEILRPYGYDWKMVNIPGQLDTLFLRTEGFGLWSTIEVYYEHISPDNEQKWIFNNWGTGYSIEGKIANPAAGKYYIRYKDSAIIRVDGLGSGLGDQQREYLIKVSGNPIAKGALPLNITSLSAYAVGQGPTTIEISGVGFSPSDTILLVDKGVGVFRSTPFAVDESGTKYKVSFDLSHAQPGNWELQIYSASGDTASAPRPLTITTASEPEIWVDILARNLIRQGRSQKIVIRYGNKGAVDAHNVVLYTIIPKEILHQFLVPKVFDYPEDTLLVRDTNYYWAPQISARSSNEFELEIKADQIGEYPIEVGFLDSIPGIQTITPLRHFKRGSKSAGGPFLKVLQEENYVPQKGDVVFRRFKLKVKGKDFETPVSIHAGTVVEREDPDGTTRTYVVEITFEKKPDAFLRASRWEFTQEEKTEFQQDIDNLNAGSLNEQDFKSKWKERGVDVENYSKRENGQWKNELADWVEVNGEGTFEGGGHPDDITPEQRQLVNDRALEVLEMHDLYGDNTTSYNDKDYSLFKDPNHCGTFVDDMYDHAEVEYEKGWNDYPFSMRNNLMNENQEDADQPILIPPDKNQPEDASAFDDWVEDFFNGLGSWILCSVGSSTPEDKYGPMGFDPDTVDIVDRKRFLASQQAFNYKIDYWNKEDATAPAAEVFIRDTLDANFDLTTFNFTEFGFLKWKVPLQGGQYFNAVIDMRPDFNLLVTVEGTLNPNTREVYWAHHSLDPETLDLPDDPLAGFLPPVDSTGYNIGWVNYSIEPLEGKPSGTIFENRAHVNFDGIGPWGKAPPYGPYRNAYDFEAPSSNVLPLDAEMENDTFTLNWTGEDSTGAGVKDYTIYVSENSDPYTAWLIDTTATSAIFVGEPGKNYQFYSVARDHLNHIEDHPAAEDASTTIKGRDLLVSPVINLQGAYESGIGLMRDNLRESGNLPLMEPYTSFGFTHVGGGEEETQQSVFNITGSDAIVDWVFLELRDKTNATMVVATRSALLQRDGDVVDIDGQSPVTFTDLSTDHYYLVVKHRNHLGVMSAGPIAFSSTTSVVDFTSDLIHTFGGANGIAVLTNGRLGLYSGDFNPNGQVQNTDYNFMVATLGAAGYESGDFDLNGQVQNTDLQLKLIPNIGKGELFPQ